MDKIRIPCNRVWVKNTTFKFASLKFSISVILRKAARYCFVQFGRRLYRGLHAGQSSCSARWQCVLVIFYFFQLYYYYYYDMFKKNNNFVKPKVTTGQTKKQLQNRCHILSIRRSNLRAQIRLVDLFGPGARSGQPQRRDRPGELRRIGRMGAQVGSNTKTRRVLSVLSERALSRRHVLYLYPSQNTLLSNQHHIALCLALDPECGRILSTARLRYYNLTN